MLLPTTGASLALCLALIPSVWPQTTSNSADVGVGTGGTCRINVQTVDVFGTCMTKSQCTSTELWEIGNCIEFMERCCIPSSRGSLVETTTRGSLVETTTRGLLVETTTQSKVTIPSLNSRSQEGCGRRRPGGISERINSQNQLEFANFGEFPWMVVILINNQVSDNGAWSSKTYQGAGSLIGPQAVLTVAHLVREALLKGTPLKVRAGESDTEDDANYPYVDSPVETIYTHELYNSITMANDIALLVLKDVIKVNVHIGFACLPERGQIYPIGEECYATGWGTEMMDGTLQNKMKKMKLTIVARPDCIRTLQRSRLGYSYMLPRLVICADGKTQKKTCIGDGGGPLVCPMPEAKFHYMQFGITSWAVDCGDKNPHGYTNVAAFRQWIDNKMRANNLPTSTYVY